MDCESISVPFRMSLRHCANSVNSLQANRFMQNCWGLSDWLSQPGDRKEKYGASCCNAGKYYRIYHGHNCCFCCSEASNRDPQNIFYKKKITKTFDLKGSLRGRFAAQIQNAKDDSQPETPTFGSEASQARRRRGRATRLP